MDRPDTPLVLVMAASCVLQFSAALLSIRMIRPSGAFIAWILLACGFVIQGVRRLVSLIYLLDGSLHGEMTVEVLGLAISVLMLCGILKFRPLFKKIRLSQQLLLDQKNSLKKANDELEAFVSTASHDLRTPLTVIIGYTEHLKEKFKKSHDAQTLQCLDEIESQGTRMETLLEDLLALARVGYVERPSEPVDTNQIIENILTEIGSQLAAGKVTVKTGLLPKIHLPETLLSEIFKNLILNALYYGCNKGDSIEVGGEMSSDKVSYYVRDHGPGVPEEDRERIFEMFYRGSRKHERKGTGLGLAIVRKIAQLYGGRAWVEVAPQGGSTFWFELTEEKPLAGRTDTIRDALLLT